jgi:hypothetical protein
MLPRRDSELAFDDVTRVKELRMKRLFPRAVHGALLGAVGLAMVVGCDVDNSVKKGAPVLVTLTIVDPSGARTNLASDTPACAVGAKEGDTCDPTVAAVCTTPSSLCHCDAPDAMCFPKKGLLTCSYAPMSTVVATFDRLIDTKPLTPGGSTDVVDLTATPTTTAKASADYTANGSAVGLVFPAFFHINGPFLTISGVPAFPTDASVTATLKPAIVRAKDGKTAFSGTGALAGGSVVFKTTAFSAGITVPAPPAPMTDMPMSTPMCPAASGGAGGGSAGAGGAAGGGAGAGGSAGGGAGAGGSAGAGTDAGATSDAGAISDAGATSDAGAASDAGATSDAAATSDAGAASDAAATSDAGAAASDAAEPPSTDVPADMNMAPITIAFSNPVGKDILDHITMTVDDKPFTDFVTPDPAKDFPTASVAITPKTMWEAGKKYGITVDANAVDVLGKKLGAGNEATASFTMSAK